MTGFAILGPGLVADSHRKAMEANANQGARLMAMGHLRQLNWASKPQCKPKKLSEIRMNNDA